MSKGGGVKGGPAADTTCLEELTDCRLLRFNGKSFSLVAEVYCGYVRRVTLSSAEAILFFVALYVLFVRMSSTLGRPML